MQEAVKGVLEKVKVGSLPKPPSLIEVFLSDFFVFVLFFCFCFALCPRTKFVVPRCVYSPFRHFFVSLPPATT